MDSTAKGASIVALSRVIAEGFFDHPQRLKRFVLGLPFGMEIHREVNWFSSPAEVAFAVAGELERRGLVNHALFASLYSELPGRSKEISALQGLCVVRPDTTADQAPSWIAERVTKEIETAGLGSQLVTAVGPGPTIFVLAVNKGQMPLAAEFVQEIEGGPSGELARRAGCAVRAACISLEPLRGRVNIASVPRWSIRVGRGEQPLGLASFVFWSGADNGGRLNILAPLHIFGDVSARKDATVFLGDSFAAASISASSFENDAVLLVADQTKPELRGLQQTPPPLASSANLARHLLRERSVLSSFPPGSPSWRVHILAYGVSGTFSAAGGASLTVTGAWLLRLSRRGYRPVRAQPGMSGLTVVWKRHDAPVAAIIARDRERPDVVLAVPLIEMMTSIARAGK